MLWCWIGLWIASHSRLYVNGPSEPGRLRDVCVCQWVKDNNSNWQKSLHIQSWAVLCPHSHWTTSIHPSMVLQPLLGPCLPQKMPASSLPSAHLLHPLLPSICDVSLQTMSSHLVLGSPTGLVLWNFPSSTAICEILQNIPLWTSSNFHFTSKQPWNAYVCWLFYFKRIF